MRVRPRALVHRGIVDAAGFLLDTRLIGVGRARRRILSMWVPGTRIYANDGSLLVLLPSPSRVACDSSPGLPLTALGKWLLALPLAADELKILDAPVDSILLAEGGLSIVRQLSDFSLEGPESWLDLDDYCALETASLGSPPAPPRIVTETRPFDARKQIDGIPPEAPALAQFLSSMRSRQAQIEGPSFSVKVIKAIRSGIAKAV